MPVPNVNIFPFFFSKMQLATSWPLDGNAASCVLQLTQREQFPFRETESEREKDKTTITGACYEGLAAYSQLKTNESICDNEED